MTREIFGKVMWVGRATVFLVGLAVILALVFGVATTALGANGKPFLLGKYNVASAISTLVKQGPGPALKLQVGAGQPPLAVNSSARVANLNAATAGRADAAANAQNANTLDGKDSTQFLGKTEKAADADQLDGQDSGKLGQMWAVVDSGCTIVRESGASGRAPSNFCGVNFERDISNCAFIVSISESGAGYPFTDRTGEVWAFTGDGTPNGGSKSAVYVRTADSSGARVGLPFHVAVFC